MSDPFAVLGLDDTASPAAVRTARRDLAKLHHPDAGGDAEMMRSINQAAGRALQEIANRVTAVASVDRSASEPHDEPTGVSRDVPSFTVEALPVETFEALLVVSSWIGEVLDDAPRGGLDTHRREPTPGWCRLEVVPDAGGWTVSITLANEAGQPVPDIERVRDTWIDQLNRYDWR